ncbi:MAG: TolC family protein [Phycisphaerales bacterium]|nr:TolC family protein [Phycisphaerales bacterium]
MDPNIQKNGWGTTMWKAGHLGGACTMLAGLLCVGCAVVDPKPDYARARDMVKTSTGQDAVYSPEEPGLTEEQVQALFVDGLTQEEAVRVALLNNREFQAAFYEIGVARADWVQSGLLANPTINTSLRFPSGGGGSTDFLGAFSQNIADLWQIPMRKNVAAEVVEQAVMRVAGVGAGVAGNVRRTYQNAVTAEETADLADRNTKRAHELVDMVRGRKSPSASPLDVDMMLGDAMQAELSAQGALVDVAVMRHELAKLLSLGMLPDDVCLTDRVHDPGPVPLSADKAIAVARAKRVDLQAAGKAVDATQAQIKAEYMKILPGFSLGLDMEREPQVPEDGKGRLATIRDSVRSSLFSQATGLPLSGMSRTAEPEEEVTLGPLLAITLPIFDQNLAQIAKAKLLHEQAVKQREMLEANVGHDLAIQHARAELASRNLAFYRDKLLPQVERNLDAAAADYQEGKIQAITLLDAQRSLFDARHQLLHAQLSAGTAMSDLEQAVGAPLAVAATMPAEELVPADDPGKTKSIMSLPISNMLPSDIGQSLLNEPGKLPASQIKDSVDKTLEMIPSEESSKK